MEGNFQLSYQQIAHDLFGHEFNLIIRIIRIIFPVIDHPWEWQYTSFSNYGSFDDQLL